jgi:HD-like signal output (HDOD) protein/GGDEF domain-containing protein
MKVLDLTRNPQINTRELKECIENDPAMASRILRVVNSSLFGRSGEVSDLGQALTLLGIKPLKLLVLGFSLPSGLFLDVEAKTLAWHWRHTLTKAVAGREISQRVWRIPGDDAFIAGLLQDLGMLLLIQELGSPYIGFLDRAVAEHLDIAAIETQTMGFSHTTVSARLLAQWNLPEPLVEAVAWQPTDPEPSSLSKILYLAELVARLLADGQPDVLGQLLQAGRNWHRLFKPQLEPLVSDLQEKVDQLADILSLQLPDGLEYRDVLADAHRQLANVATRTAEALLQSRETGPFEAEEEAFLGEFQELAEAVAGACAVAEDCPTAEDRPAERPSALHFPADSPWPGASILFREEAAAVPCADAVPTREKPTANPGGCQAVVRSAATADSSLAAKVARAVAASRQARCPLSLLLVEPAQAEQQLALLGPNQFHTLRRLVESACRSVEHPGMVCASYSDAGFALILPDCERRRAVELGNELIATVRRAGLPGCGDLAGTLKLGIGAATVALPPRNFPHGDLLDGASRCLYGSHACGGSVVKSIEIY